MRKYWTFSAMESKQNERLEGLEYRLRSCDEEIARTQALVSRLRANGAEFKRAEINLSELLDARATLRIELLTVLQTGERRSP